MNTANLPTMLGIQWRTGWKVIIAWVATLVLLMLVTASSMAGTYDTPEKVASYALTIGTGPAMYMMNGRIAGMDSLGGIVANEFGFMVSFVLPLMGIALISRSTRREEESGRQELLLAASIGRQAPLLAALFIGVLASVVMALGTWAVTLPFALDHTGMAWYAAGFTGVTLWFAALTAVAAQLVENGRGVWIIGLMTALIAIIVRGIGAVNDAWYGLLSPLGLMDAMHAFGEPRAWPLYMLLAEALVMVAVASWLNAHRDLGGALIRSGAGPRQASSTLRTQTGLAVFEHRGALLGWSVGGVVLMVIYGSLAQTIIDALEANANLQVFVDAALDAVLAMFVMMAAMLAAAAGIAMVGAVAADETSGRLEALLAGPRGRIAWLARHLLVVSGGALLVLLLGGLTLAAAVSASLGNDSSFGDVWRGTLSHISGVLAFSGLTAYLWTWKPRLRPLAWVVFGVSFFVAYMGEAVKLPRWLIDNSPFMLAGNVPVGDVDWVGVGILAAIAVVTHALALVGLQRRDVPTH